MFQATSSMMSPAQRLMQAQMMQKAAMKPQMAASHAPQAQQAAQRFGAMPAAPVIAAADSFMSSRAAKPPVLSPNVAFIAGDKMSTVATINNFIKRFFGGK